MTQNESIRMEDVASVGTRVSWGAIAAGAMIALGMYFLLTTLAGAVGWSIRDHTTPADLQIGAIAWAIATTIAALFVGGVVTSLLTAGEDKIEAVLYGVIMWAFLFTLLAAFAVAGHRSGLTSMTAIAASAQEAVSPWEAAAREAGVPASAVEELRRKAEQPENQAARKEAATRLAWYAFAGTWLSMFAAAAGAWMGAGPTFRIVAVRPGQRVIGAV